VRRVVAWRIAVAFGGGAAALACAAVGACSSSPKLVGAGGECFQATDCQDGLVCIPKRGGSSVCSSDLSSIQTTEEAGGAPTDASDDGPADGPPPGDGPLPDSEPDTVVPADTAPPGDTGVE